jgi:hypothetical protein
LREVLQYQIKLSDGKHLWIKLYLDGGPCK